MMSLALLLALLSGAELDGAESVRTSWGVVQPADPFSGAFLARLEKLPADGRLTLPSTLPPVLRTFFPDDPDRVSLPLEFDAEPAGAWVDLPPGFDHSSNRRVIVLETAASSGQRTDGRIVFVAGDAQLDGGLKLEAQAGHSRIGSWGGGSDAASWDYEATRPGKYDLEITYSLATPSDAAETVFEFTLASAGLSGKLRPTGSARRYRSIIAGRVSIAKAGESKLRFGCQRLPVGAVFSLKALILRPASEGKPIVQEDDGNVTCHARDVTIRGVKVQYEPKPEKNTVGFWTNERDQVAWDFTLKTPGRFDVEILQGCGKGHGGSEVELSIDDQSLRFIVEDTGHFQNFVPRTIGAVHLTDPGRHAMRVKPIHKPGVAVMDLRQVRLIRRDE